METIEILQHNIEYFYDTEQEMPESEREHVKRSIIDGYREGQLVYMMPDGSSNIGWWKIVKP